MSFASSVRRFAAQVAEARRDLWPVTVQFPDSTTAKASKTPTKLSRVPNDQGSGWTQRGIATFLLDAAGAFAPDIGAEFLVTSETDAPGELNTRWRCFDLTRAALGGEHRCVCFRLD